MRTLSVAHIFGTMRCYPIETLHVHSLCQDKPYLPLVEQFSLNQIVIKHFLGAVENHKSVASATQPQWLYNLSREEYISSNVMLKPLLYPDRMLLYCSLPFVNIVSALSYRLVWILGIEKVQRYNKSIQCPIENVHTP